jgi:hypothetical protein
MLKYFNQSESCGPLVRLSGRTWLELIKDEHFLKFPHAVQFFFWGTISATYVYLCRVTKEIESLIVAPTSKFCGPLDRLSRKAWLKFNKRWASS